MAIIGNCRFCRLAKRAKPDIGSTGCEVPDVLEVAFCDKVWPAIESAAVTIWGGLTTGQPYSGPFFGTQNGFRYVGVSTEFEAGTYTFRWAFLPLVGPTATVPMEYLVQEITNFLRYVEHAPPSSLPSESAAMGNWRTAYLGTIMTCLEQLTGASCDLGESVELVVVAGLAKRTVQTVTASTAGRTYQLNFEANSGPAEQPTSMEGWYVQAEPWQAKVNLPGTGESGQLDRAVEALEDIAAQDYQISINNGQAIFSVKGKITST